MGLIIWSINRLRAVSFALSGEFQSKNIELNRIKKEMKISRVPTFLDDKKNTKGDFRKIGKDMKKVLK